MLNQEGGGFCNCSFRGDITTVQPNKYPCHIYGVIGHIMTKCLQFGEMPNMFKDKGVKIVNEQYIIENKTTNVSVHVVDVNMAITRSKANEAQVFTEREPIKKKYIVD
jgi:hypothetical protein